MPFFWRWMLGDAALSLANVLIFAVLWAVTPTAAAPCAFYLAVAALVAGWQAWLLFGASWRLVAWMASFLLAETLDVLAVNGDFPLMAEEEMGLVLGSILALLLIKVRRRPWALWLVSLGGYVATKWYSDELRDLGGVVLNAGLDMTLGRLLPGSFGTIQNLFLLGFITSWVMFHGLPVAAVLAFCMPPVVRKEGVLSSASDGLARA